MDCSCDALYGDTGLMAPARSSMRRKFAGMTNVSTPPRRWIKCALDFSYTGRRSAGRQGGGWTQSLQKAVHGVQIALNIADVARRTAAGATYGSTPLPASLVAVASQPEMDTQVGDMEGRKWQGVLCVQPYWITCGWLISRRCRQPRNA
jgi:hypothetical protein